MGVSGTVVSRKQLKLNMARNDILLTKCDVWKSIKKKLDIESLNSNKKKTRLTDDERINLIQRLKAGEIETESGYTAHTLKLITDIKGRYWPISKLSDLRYSKTKVAVAPAIDSKLGARVHESK